jgi:hypothetical protein
MHFIPPHPPLLSHHHHAVLVSNVVRSFPLVERAVADVPALSDPEFAAGIRGHAENLLRRSRGVAIPASGGGGGGGSSSGGASAPVSRFLFLLVVTGCITFFPASFFD